MSDISEGQDIEKLVWEQLKTVYDPEIPINLVDLGLIHECKITPLGDGAKRVDIKMLLTAPGCPMGDVMKADIVQKVSTVPGIKEVGVEIVMEPSWNRDMMSEAAKLQLGL